MERLAELFRSWSGREPEKRRHLPVSGSHRDYYRLEAGPYSAIGVVGTSAEENRAFVVLAKRFADRGIRVPAILAESPDGLCNLQEDLGDDVLFDAIAKGRESGVYDESERALLRDTISALPAIQYACAEGFDFSVCYPQPEFDRRMVAFDLNYFKYCFLKGTKLEFAEVPLQDDFDRLTDDILQPFGPTFLYRDFQARNVMLRDGKPYFIDFQGGRRGPVWYDVASFLWQAKARYPAEVRNELLETYLDALDVELVRHPDPTLPMDGPRIDRAAFREKLRLFVLFRLLQVLGAYGYRGLFERKRHFLESIPYALDNVRDLLSEGGFFGDPTPIVSRYPYLCQVLDQLRGLAWNEADGVDRGLTVTIYSFSYKKGIPEDKSGNGGGYVFDCRASKNPGRFIQYKYQTGLDQPVIDFIEKYGEMRRFLDAVYTLVDAHVERFMERGFTHLQVSFGCTGGQHRSVYAAEHLAAHLAAIYPVRIHLIHREQNIDRHIAGRPGK